MPKFIALMSNETSEVNYTEYERQKVAGNTVNFLGVGPSESVTVTHFAVASEKLGPVTDIQPLAVPFKGVGPLVRLELNHTLKITED